MKTGTWNHVLIYSTCTYICDMYMHVHVHLPLRNLCFYSMRFLTKWACLLLNTETLTL